MKMHLLIATLGFSLLSVKAQAAGTEHKAERKADADEIKSEVDFLPLPEVELDASVKWEWQELSGTKLQMARVTHKDVAYLMVRSSSGDHVNFDILRSILQGLTATVLHPKFYVSKHKALLFDDFQQVRIDEHSKEPALLKAMWCAVQTLTDLHDMGITNVSFGSGSLFRTRVGDKLKVLVDFFHLERPSDDDAQTRRFHDVGRAGEVFKKWLASVNERIHVAVPKADIETQVTAMSESKTEALTFLRRFGHMAGYLVPLHEHREEKKARGGAPRAPRVFSEQEVECHEDHESGELVHAQGQGMGLAWGKMAPDLAIPERYETPDERAFRVSLDWLWSGKPSTLCSSVLFFQVGRGRFAVDIKDFAWLIHRPCSELHLVLKIMQSIQPDRDIKMYQIKDKPNTELILAEDVFAILEALDDQEKLIREKGLADRLRWVFAIADKTLASSAYEPLTLVEFTTAAKTTRKVAGQIP